MAFSAQLKNIKGIYGVSTFVKTHTVKILYDPTIFSDSKIQEIIFTPMKMVIKPISEKTDSVASYTFGIENFFDPMDVFYLKNLLEQKTKSCAFYTEYGCPVIAHIFFPSDSLPEINELVNIIQLKILEYKINDQKFYAEINYNVSIKPDKPKIYSLSTYYKEMYIPVKIKFNNFSNYSNSALKIYEVIIEDIIEQRDDFDYLVSHLSNDPGIVSFETILDDIEGEKARIIFVDTLTTTEAILRELNADSLRFTYNTGELGSRLNPFQFKTEGKTTFYGE
jgi:copper chaperone CopZ